MKVQKEVELRSILRKSKSDNSNRPKKRVAFKKEVIEVIFNTNVQAVKKTVKPLSEAKELPLPAVPVEAFQKVLRIEDPKNDTEKETPCCSSGGLPKSSQD